MRDNSKSIEAENELQRARQLESIAALSGGIAHDYNNLLTVIIGNVSLIQSYVNPQDMVYRLLNEVNEAAIVAKSLTQKLISTIFQGRCTAERDNRYGRPRSQRDGVLVERLQHQVSVRRSGRSIWLVDIDKTQVSQAVHNLVMNAREAMPEGGAITVSAGNDQNIDGEGVFDGRPVGAATPLQTRDKESRPKIWIRYSIPIFPPRSAAIRRGRAWACRSATPSFKNMTVK